MKAGDLVQLSDIAASYIFQTVEFEVDECYGVLIGCRDYVFEQDPPLKNKTETVWTVLVEKEIHEILERDLMWKGSA